MTGDDIMLDAVHELQQMILTFVQVADRQHSNSPIIPAVSIFKKCWNAMFSQSNPVSF